MNMQSIKKYIIYQLINYFLSPTDISILIIANYAQ